MVMSMGSKGYNGRTLVRNVKQFKENFDGIDFSKAPRRQPDKVKGSKKVFVYK